MCTFRPLKKGELNLSIRLIELVTSKVVDRYDRHKSVWASHSQGGICCVESTDSIRLDLYSKMETSTDSRDR